MTVASSKPGPPETLSTSVRPLELTWTVRTCPGWLLERERACGAETGKSTCERPAKTRRPTKLSPSELLTCKVMRYINCLVWALFSLLHSSS